MAPMKPDWLLAGGELEIRRSPAQGASRAAAGQRDGAVRRGRDDEGGPR